MNNNLWSYEISFSWDFQDVYNSAKKILNDYFKKAEFETSIEDLTDFQNIKVSCIKKGIGNEQVEYIFATGVRVKLCLEVICVSGMSGNTQYVYKCIIQDDSFTESCGQHSVSIEKLKKLGIWTTKGGDK